jgi:lipoate-protein ligase A
VETITCRLLPFSVAGGPHNMAADEGLLHSAQTGQASLRFYGWNEAIVSLGYFQSSTARESDPRLRALPFVRRPTGGATLVHHHELTYALALPRTLSRQTEPWLVRMHRIIGLALKRLGVDWRLAAEQEQGRAHSVFCFQQFTPGDLLVGGNKIAGSAQRRQKGALLQHGAILLEASPQAPQLPGILELTGHRLSLEACQDAIVQEFQTDTGWELRECPWAFEEQEALTQLAIEKYSTAEWNNKR